MRNATHYFINKTREWTTTRDVKWMGLALILAGITVQDNSRLGNAFLFLAFAGFLLLALFHALNLKTYLKATREAGARKKGPVVYFSAMTALFAIFTVLCLLRFIEASVGGQ